MKRLLFFIPFLLFFQVCLIAQDLPVTDVYTFSMKKFNDTTYNFSNPQLLTAFNLDGYNNQPHFVSDNTLYLTVQFPEDNQTDIFALDIAEKEITQITQTIESEYSPTLMPDNSQFSAVRVEADGQNTQRLWTFPMNRSTMGEAAFKDITGVGYHHWLNQYKAALFIVGEPHKLILANTLTGSQVELMDNIGRGMQRMPGDNLAFIHKVDAQTWMLKEIDTYTYRAKDIVQTLPNSEDFILLTDGTFLMGRGSKLYKFNKYKDENWVAIADFKYYGIKNITRLAINPAGGRIALVDRVK